MLDAIDRAIDNGLDTQKAFNYVAVCVFPAGFDNASDVDYHGLQNRIRNRIGTECQLRTVLT